MNKLISFLLFAFNILYVSAQGQNADTSTTQSGLLVLNYAPGIEPLIERYKKVNYSAQGPEGYRVQIFTAAGNEAKEKASAALSEFQLSFPEISAYLTYQQPNFKVRCGNYRYKSEARKLLKRIAYQYPGAFIVKDILRVEEMP